MISRIFFGCRRVWYPGWNKGKGIAMSKRGLIDTGTAEGHVAVTIFSGSDRR